MRFAENSDDVLRAIGLTEDANSEVPLGSAINPGP